MTRAEAAVAIAAALDAAHSAYWTACDTEGRALDPAADLDAPDRLLDDAHDAELQMQPLRTWRKPSKMCNLKRCDNAVVAASFGERPDGALRAIHNP